MSLDDWLVLCLVPITLWILLSGLDDLFIDLVFYLRRASAFPWPAAAELTQASQRRIAVLVALWHEHEVIEQMLYHNLAVIQYGNYEVFVGVYPNDDPTRAAVERVARRDPRVHVAVGPHDGPTSKGDCLNWAYEAMAEFETRGGPAFEIVMMHDAEDLIHPESLRLVNWFSRRYPMVQIPVLPLRTGWRDWTHGLYCDEFAEFQIKDIVVRQHLGGFLPGNGVGTGFERGALESLRDPNHGRVFDPDCLTEDYDSGLRLHAAGYRQIFVPVGRGSAPAATREYFPRQWRRAIRQRSRWVAGIALQAWEHHGWNVSPLQVYWLWRDRKGLAGNLITPLVNLLFLYCLAGAAPDTGMPTPFHHPPPWLGRVFLLSGSLSVVRVTVRVELSARVYGYRFAALAPLRMLWGNLINSAATVQALRLFITARLRRRALAWCKTDHVYPQFAEAQPEERAKAFTATLR